VATGLDRHPDLVPESVPDRVGHRSLWRPLAAATLAVVGIWALAGCAGQDQTGPPAARVSSWVTGAGGGAAIGTLRVDTANIGLALARHDPPAAVKTVCALLATDAQTAIGNLPTPDARLTTALLTAYQDAAAAGDDCYQGSSGAASLLRQSAMERAKLASLVAVAVARITALTGHPPSTSTTEAPPSGDPFGS
jgi:hypothetical protein